VIVVWKRLEEETGRWQGSGFDVTKRATGNAMRTYFNGATANYLNQGTQRFSAVAFVAGASLAIQPAAPPGPREVVHHGEALAPENGGAVGHGQQTRVDEAVERGWPCGARPQGRLRPARPSV
jgi:hypothetical protein